MNTLTVSRERLINALPPEHRGMVELMLSSGATGSFKLGPLTLRSEGLTVTFSSVELVVNPKAAKGGAR